MMLDCINSQGECCVSGYNGLGLCGAVVKAEEGTLQGHMGVHCTLARITASM